MDYTSGPYTVTFPAGITMITFDVPISHDLILEIDENFILIINGTSLATGITCNNPGQATVTIVDNEISAGAKFCSMVISFDFTTNMFVSVMIPYLCTMSLKVLLIRIYITKSNNKTITFSLSQPCPFPDLFLDLMTPITGMCL